MSALPRGPEFERDPVDGHAVDGEGRQTLQLFRDVDVRREPPAELVAQDRATGRRL